MLPVPDSAEDAVAAALPCPGLTAMQALGKVPLQANRDVLVVGTGGTVAFLLAQLAVRAGWRVWATAAAVHHEKLLATGVAGAFDYKDEDWRARLAKALGSRRLHAVFDTVSGPHAASLLNLIGYNGHLVCIQDRVERHPLPAFTTAVSLHEVALNSIHEHGTDEDWCGWKLAGMELFTALSSGVVRLTEIETLPFGDVPSALAAMKSGERRGNLVAVL